MSRSKHIVSGLAILAMLAAACGGASPPPVDPAQEGPKSTILSDSCSLADFEAHAPHQGSWAPAPDDIDGLARLAYADGTRIVLNTEGGPATFVAGVNLGPTVPGFQPGEVAIPAEDFRRWFPMMADLGFRAIRVYAIQPPAFYEELQEYNLANPDSPLYLIHGVWIPEHQFMASHDLYEPGLQEEFFDEIADSISVVHGDADLPEQLGKASGRFEADVSPWTYAWLLGIEWDPIATANSDRANAGRPPHDGEFFAATDDASATEVWLAEALDYTASQLAERGVSVPIGFVNWPTTDPLNHPDEPLPREDMVGVDANHVTATGWHAGTFASYHAYPYYPDFQRYEPGIADCEYRGTLDHYAGYLAALRRHHAGMPVMITEFGVPSAWAHAHAGPQERHQGDHSEQNAMAIDAEMMAIIHDLGFSGGYVFEWVDEWFKFTWNTIDYELPPNRRQLWMNPWTNEAHFGVVAIEPGGEPVVIIDGDRSEWSANGSQVILESREGVREIRAVKDEGFLYLALTLDEDVALEDLVLGFDVLPDAAGGLPGSDGASSPSDYAVTLGGANGQVWVAGHADAYTKTYGLAKGYFDVDSSTLSPGSGSWSEHQLITNRPLTVPTTGEEMPAEMFNAGRLLRGTSDPTAPDFDSRTAWQTTPGFVELRLPYQAIGIADPSSRLAFAVDDTGTVSTVPFDRVEIDTWWAGRTYETAGYSWEVWQLPEWHERVKAGADQLAEANRRTMESG